MRFDIKYAVIYPLNVVRMYTWLFSRLLSAGVTIKTHDVGRRVTAKRVGNYA